MRMKKSPAVHIMRPKKFSSSSETSPAAAAPSAPQPELANDDPMASAPAMKKGGMVKKHGHKEMHEEKHGHEEMSEESRHGHKAMSHHFKCGGMASCDED